MSRPAEAAVTLTPTATAWLQPLSITRDEAHIYHLADGHVFPISTTGLISAVTKTSTQMEAIMASKHIWQPRGDLVHLALE
ncbi:MAG: hypothetical protein EBV32_05090, partial [Proteobacteria bacterium]|nr:hypothetical protein [Candidatus Fonsibacter lacus]